MRHIQMRCTGSGRRKNAGLLSFTQFYSVLLGFTQFYSVFFQQSKSKQTRRMQIGFTRFYSVGSSS